jgi:hypothetical protein
VSQHGLRITAHDLRRAVRSIAHGSFHQSVGVVHGVSVYAWRIGGNDSAKAVGRSRRQVRSVLKCTCTTSGDCWLSAAVLIA